MKYQRKEKFNSIKFDPSKYYNFIQYQTRIINKTEKRTPFFIDGDGIQQFPQYNDIILKNDNKLYLLNDNFEPIKEEEITVICPSCGYIQYKKITKLNKIIFSCKNCNSNIKCKIDLNLYIKNDKS